MIFLPFFNAALRLQISKEKLSFEVKWCLEVVRFHVDFGPQHDELIQFDLFLAVPDQERFRAVGLVGFSDLGRGQTMLVQLLRFQQFFGFVLQHVALEETVGLRCLLSGRLGLQRVLSELREETELHVIEALKVEVDVAELVQSYSDLHNCTQRHLIIKIMQAAYRKALLQRRAIMPIAIRQFSSSTSPYALMLLTTQ